MPSAKPGEEFKVCCKCQVLYPLENFYKDKRRPDGLTPECGSCIKERANAYYKNKRGDEEWRLRSNKQAAENFQKRKYGLLPGDYNRLYEKQSGKCYLCFGEGENLVVDHNHYTGEVRGLMHAKCNTALGMLGDSDSMLYHLRLFFEFVEKR